MKVILFFIFILFSCVYSFAGILTIAPLMTVTTEAFTGNASVISVGESGNTKETITLSAADRCKSSEAALKTSVSSYIITKSGLVSSAESRNRTSSTVKSAPSSKFTQTIPGTQKRSPACQQKSWLYSTYFIASFQNAGQQAELGSVFQGDRICKCFQRLCFISQSQEKATDLTAVMPHHHFW